MTGQSLYVLIFLASLFTGSGHPPEVKKPVDGIRIAWDYRTRKRLSPADTRYAGYARMIVLRDNSLFCIYESEGSAFAIKSTDGAATWSAPVLIAARENEIARVVPEVLQLQDNSILVSYNLRPHAKNTDPTKRFGIEVKRSTDGGNTWSAPVEVYKAGYEFGNGCWEPAQIQLSSGEIQLYIANEGPYTKTNEQEITMFRSIDQGTTWSKGETVSFRKDSRDGMPVPLILKNGKEIVFAIEDNGIESTVFKPVIIRTSLENNWTNAPVLALSPDRHHAMDLDNRIPGTKYAGAPYIRQLLSGETILSYQGNEFREANQWDISDMIVTIGTTEARDFNRKSLPFFLRDSTKTCLWNSLTVMNDSTVIALASTNGYSDHTGVWMIQGHLLHEPAAEAATLTVDGETDESIWKKKPAVFIGGYGPTQARACFGWDSKMFYITAEVMDNEVTEEDAIRFYMDPTGQSTSLPADGVFSVEVSSQGILTTEKGHAGLWTDWKTKTIRSATKRTTQGYRMEMAIPWKELKRTPSDKQRFGFQMSLRERNTRDAGYDEPLSGNKNDAPYTWSPIHFKH